jgi:hypothetical protein
MKFLTISDYQLPVLACICLFFAMSFYWISLTSRNFSKVGIISYKKKRWAKKNDNYEAFQAQIVE